MTSERAREMTHYALNELNSLLIIGSKCIFISTMCNASM